MFGSRQDLLKLFQVECLDNVLQEFKNGSSMVTSPGTIYGYKVPPGTLSEG